MAQTEPAGDEGEIALFDEPVDRVFNACPPEVETRFQGCTTLMALHKNATISSCYCASNVTPVPQGSPLPIPNGRRNIVAFGSAAFVKFNNAGQDGGDPCEQRNLNGRPTTVCW